MEIGRCGAQVIQTQLELERRFRRAKRVPRSTGKRESGNGKKREWPRRLNPGRALKRAMYEMGDHAKPA
jgi:hypothetical protein